MNIVRLVLKPDVSREDVLTVAWRSRWIVDDEISPDEDHPYEIVWLLRDRAIVIHYIEDSQIETDYLEIRGDESIDDVIESLESDLGVFTWSELTERIRKTDEADPFIGAIYDFSLVAAEAFNDRSRRQEALDLYRQALSFPDPDARIAVLFAAGYTIALAGYEGPAEESLSQLIEEIAKNDPDLGVREYASELGEQLAHEKSEYQ